MATVPFLFFFEQEGDFFGITIIVHLPVAKFWAALIVGVHWLSQQVWSFAPTLVANAVAVCRAWIQAGFLPCWQSAFSRLQTGISGRQGNSTPPSPDQSCTSISCPQLGKNATQANASQVSFPRAVPGAPGDRVEGGISMDHQKQDPFLDVFNGNIFQEDRPPDLCVNLTSRT